MSYRGRDSDSSRRGGYSRGGPSRGGPSRGGPYRGGSSRGGGFDGGRGRGGFSGPPKPVATINVANIVEKDIDPSIKQDNVVIPNMGAIYGKSGETVKIVSNYFRVSSLLQTTFSQYQVTFNPDIENIRVRSAIIHSQKSLFRDSYSFDGNNLFLSFRLSQDITTFKARRNSNRNEAEKSDDDVCTVTISFTNIVPANSPRVIQICNLIFKRNLKTLGYKQIKRHYFDNKRKIDFPEYNLEIWPGIQSAITAMGNNLVLCCDVTYHVVMRENVLKRLETIFKSCDKRDFINKAKQMLIGQVVMTRYNNATYRIDDIDFNAKPTGTFSMKNGDQVSYCDYYKTKYNLNITDMKQPLLISIPKKKREANKKGEKGLKEIEEHPVHLIPELCCLTGMSDEMRENFQLTRSISDQTRMDPTQRSQVLVDMINSIYENPTTKSYMENWGIKIENRLMSLPGRSYEPEKIFAGNNISVPNVDADWTRGLADIKLVAPAKLSKWMLVFSRNSGADASNFVQKMIEISGKMGFVIGKPHMVEVQATNANIIKSAINDNFNSSCQMVVCILDSPRKDVYDAIKRICCCELGVLSQVVLTKTLRKKGLGSIIMKIGIQANVKLGGEAWIVKIPMKKSMVVGIDVCHDPQSKKSSYGAMVCSMNDKFTRYYSCITVQHSQGEIIDSLSVNFQSALQEYYKINQCYPEKIVVFRDGVGDGQFGVLRDYELPQFLDVLKNLKAPTTPTFAFVVVKKRISSRLFTPGTDRLMNPKPGTIVDCGITQSNYPNFYLISQCVRQGTVNPTHYVIVHNDTVLQTDHLQLLSYKLTHLYYNWSGTIRVPAPCQYAHKLCFIASNSVRHEPKRSLAHYLYYL